MTDPDDGGDQSKTSTWSQGDKEPERGGQKALLLGFCGAMLATVLAPGGVTRALILAPAGLALTIAAIVIGIRALRRARGRQVKAPGAVGGLLLGGLGAVAACMVFASFAVFGNTLTAYQKCLGSALTHQARQDCEQQFYRDVAERVPYPLPGNPPFAG